MINTIKTQENQNCDVIKVEDSSGTIVETEKIHIEMKYYDDYLLFNYNEKPIIPKLFVLRKPESFTFKLIYFRSEYDQYVQVLLNEYKNKCKIINFTWTKE
jgi:hypothetical protein